MTEIPSSTYQDPSLTQGNNSGDNELDRTRLNEITSIALRPGALFGRDVVLTDYDREQLRRVSSTVSVELEPRFENPDWKKFMDLVEEGTKKGVLISFASQEGTNVPTWCVNGGDDPEVKKIRRKTDSGDIPAIQVPEEIFHLYHWKKTVAGLDRYITTSNETLKSTSTRFLGEDLRQLAAFIKQSKGQAD